MSESAVSKRYLIGGGAAACAVCCAPPVLALVGIASAGIVGTAAALAFAGLVFARGGGGERAGVRPAKAAAGPRVRPERIKP